MKRKLFSILVSIITLMTSLSAFASIEETLTSYVEPWAGPFVNFIFAPLVGSEAILDTGFPWMGST